jgi:haloalkane dehalogenase
MQYLRTPDECFENLVDYPFQPHYQVIPDGEGEELRIHYLDEGSGSAGTMLLMHGQPTWSYLYRHMIHPLVAAGYRVIAPDLVGFGRSDKPTSIDDYTYARHVRWMSDWLTALDLQQLILFCQDWGGLIGLRLVAAFPERFAALVVSNTGLPRGMVPPEFTEPLKEAYKTLPVVKVQELGERFADDSGIPGFFYWRKFCAESADFDVGDLMKEVSVNPLSDSAIAGYRAPFPDQSYMAGARKFPTLVPLLHDEDEVPENTAAWETLKQFEKPVMLAFGDRDPVTAGGDMPFLKEVKGARGVPHRTIEKGGHFVQEDQPEACVQALLEVAELVSS